VVLLLLLLLLMGQPELPMFAVVVLEGLLMKVVCGCKCDRKHHRLGLAACLLPSTARREERTQSGEMEEESRI
jgi:hypothetical protein